MRSAVLDLGSSSFHLLIADVTPEGGITPIVRERQFLNLGLQLVGDGRIPRSSTSKAVQTLRRFRGLVERSGAERCLPIATSALREATNRGELADRLEDAVGVPIRFVDGAEEAELMFAGVAASVSPPQPVVVAMDLGGGSLEVARGDHAGVAWTASLPVGAARSSAVFAHDPPSREERRALRRSVRDALKPLAARIRPDETSLVACGGTARALAKIDAADRWGTPPPSVNQLGMTTDRLRGLARRLAGGDRGSRLLIPGIDERRVDLLPAGATILAAAATALSADRLTVSGWGLREGAILEDLGLVSRPLPSARALRERSIEQLRATWEPDGSHGRVVGSIAARLFDATATLHRLGDRERELLVFAGWIHEIGVRISADGFHKHGSYLLEHAAPRGFAPEDIAMLVSIVRFQRGGEPKTSCEAYARLSDEDRERCATMIALFRVAHGIARLRGSAATSVRMRSGRTLEIVVSGSSDPAAVAAEARAHAPLLASRLGTGVEIRTDDRAGDRASA